VRDYGPLVVTPPGRLGLSVLDGQLGVSWSAAMPENQTWFSQANPSTDAWMARNLRSRPTIRRSLTSDGLGEASRNGQPFPLHVTGHAHQGGQDPSAVYVFERPLGYPNRWCITLALA
jgi:hypothetical protein